MCPVLNESALRSCREPPEPTDSPMGISPSQFPKLNLNILAMLSKCLQPTPNLLALLCPQRLRTLHQLDRLERRTQERCDGVECLRYRISVWRCVCTGRLTRSISFSSVPRPGPNSMIRTFSGRPGSNPLHEEPYAHQLRFYQYGSDARIVGDIPRHRFD